MYYENERSFGTCEIGEGFEGRDINTATSGSLRIGAEYLNEDSLSL